MPNIEWIVREINRDLAPQFEEKLRAYLADQDKDWLIEQVIRLTLDAHSLEEKDRQHVREEKNRRLQERGRRVEEMNLDERKLGDENNYRDTASLWDVALITSSFRPQPFSYTCALHEKTSEASPGPFLW